LSVFEKVRKINVHHECYVRKYPRQSEQQLGLSAGIQSRTFAD
jgi:hypothetical protein